MRGAWWLSAVLILGCGGEDTAEGDVPGDDAELIDARPADASGGAEPDAAPGDASAAEADAAGGGPDAASAQPDGAAREPDVGPPDAAPPGGDAQVAEPDAAAALDAAPDAMGPDAAVPAGDAGPGGDAAQGGDAAPGDDAGPAGDAAPDDADSGPDAAAGVLHFAGGDAEGRWCGQIDLTGAAVIRPDTTLTICAGSTISVSGPNTRIDVAGTLRVVGTAEAPVILDGAGGWVGLRVDGTLDAAHLTIRGAMTCVQGLADSSVTLSHALLDHCGSGFSLANGAAMDHVTVLGGSSLRVSGGVLRMTDSLVDLLHPEQSPDCTSWSGGGAVLDHVRITGCHCPLHINRAPDGVTISHSIFDAAAYAMMIASAQATVRDSYLSGRFADVLDIGAGDGVDADIGGNYYDGAAPAVDTANPGQFSGAGDFLADRPADLGPRD